MRMILKHILRNIWAKKGRSLLIILALIIATTVFVLNLIVPNEILLKIEETYRKMFGKVDIKITLAEENVDFNDINFGTEKINYSIISQLDGTDENGNLIVLYGANFQDGKKMNFIVSNIDELKENEVVISNKYEDKYAVGDKINFYYNGNNYELKIAEIIEKKGINAQEADDETTIIVANLEALQTINNNEKIKDSALYIDVENDDNINDYLEYLKQTNNNNYNIRKILDSDTLKEEISYVSSIMLIMFVMATIMIFIVVNSLNKIIISERMPVIGTFRSVGATKGKMNFILVLENMVYGLIGGLLGVLLSYVINSKISTLFISVSGTELSRQTSGVSITTLLTGVLFAVVLEILMTIHSIVKANKKPVKDIIFDVQSTRYVYKRISIILGVLSILISIIIANLNTNNEIVPIMLSIVLALLGTYNLIPMLMKFLSVILAKIFKVIEFRTTSIASKNLGYNKMIISSSKIIIISLALIISILNVSKVISNLFESFKYIYGNDYSKSIMAYNLSQEKEQYDKLLEKDNIQDLYYTYYYYEDNITYNNGKNFIKNSNPLFVTEEENFLGIKELNYKIKDLKDNEILIDEKLLEKNNIQINDTIKIRFEILNKELEFKVVGTINSVYYTTSRNVILLNYNYYIENITDVPVQLIVVVKEDKNLEEIKKEVKEELKEPFIKIKTLEEYLDDQKKDVDGIVNLIYIVVGLAIGLAFVGIINNQIIGFMQRKRELAILNSTCMSRAQIKNMLFAETVLTNISSCGIAIIVSYFMTGIIDSFMQSMSMYIEMIYDWQNALRFIVIMFIVLLLILVIPSRKIRKMNLVNEIKYE